MLEITIPASEPTEQWDERTQEFIQKPGHDSYTLQLEHSLVSLYKWESKWEKPFLQEQERTDEETIDYIRCMTLTENVPSEVYYSLTDENINDIYKYINAKMTATWFKEEQKKPSRDIITAELIYYWMISLQIPPEYRHWHLNQLMTLIRVCSIKNQPPKKMGKAETARHNAALNASRRRKHSSRR